MNFQRIVTEFDFPNRSLKRKLPRFLKRAHDLCIAFRSPLGQNEKHAKLAIQEWICPFVQGVNIAD